MNTGFNFKKYLIRVAKYFIWLIVILLIVIGIFTITSKSDGFRYENLFRPGTGGQMLLFLVVISFVYPLVGYGKRKVYLNKSYTEDKDKIRQIFLNSKYVVTSEEGNIITFRHSSTFARAMRMFEDTITIDGSDNPIVMEGLRKDLIRFSRSIEYTLRDPQE